MTLTNIQVTRIRCDPMFTSNFKGSSAYYYLQIEAAQIVLSSRVDEMGLQGLHVRRWRHLDLHRWGFSRRYATEAYVVTHLYALITQALF